MVGFKVFVEGEEAVIFSVPEVASSEPLSEYFEKLIAALSSNPVIVKIEE